MEVNNSIKTNALYWICNQVFSRYSLGLLLPIFNYLGVLNFNGDLSSFTAWDGLKVLGVLIFLMEISNLITTYPLNCFFILLNLVTTFVMISYCNSREDRCAVDYQAVISSSIGFVFSNMTETK